MSWDKELEELRHRERLAEQMGGEEKVARQHSRGKMDARARLAALVDPGSFREIGKIAGKASYDQDGNLEHILPAPFLFGKAEINGRPVVATSRGLIAGTYLFNGTVESYLGVPYATPPSSQPATPVEVLPGVSKSRV